MILLALLLACAESDVSEYGDWPSIATESAVCFSLFEESRTDGVGFHQGIGPRYVAGMGLDSETWAPVTEIADPKGLPYFVASLARLDADLFWCTRFGGMTRFNMETGETEVSGRDCDAVTDIGGGLVVQSQPKASWPILTWYESWDAVLADDGQTVLADLHGESRIGRQDGDVIASWHSTDRVERFEIGSGLGLEVPLEGYDDWVWGLSGVGDRLFVLSEYRADEEHKYGVPKIAEFNGAGFAGPEYHIGNNIRPNGLVCSGPVDPDTFTDEHVMGPRLDP